MKLLAQILIPLLFLSLTLGNVAHAEELEYTEFTTQISSQAISVSSNDTPSQHFKPYNDYISGVDFWVDNNNISGAITVELRREIDNQLLASKTVTVPAIQNTWGGQKFHVAFSSPTQVVSNTEYKINFITSSPSLRLYYSPLAVVRQHNSNYTAGQSVLPGYLGSEEQEFAFHFALYEDEESSDPIITNAGYDVISSTKTEISFNVNEPVDYRVLFNKSGFQLTSGSGFHGFYTSCPAGIGTCKVDLQTVPDTAYDYQIVVKDPWGNESTRGGVFTSKAGTSGESGGGEETPSPLTIGDAQVTLLTSNSARVSWETDRAANSRISVSVPNGLTISDDTYEVVHSFDIPPVLKSSSEYSVTITSVDMDGIEATENLSFSTIGNSPTEDSEESNTEENAGGETEDSSAEESTDIVVGNAESTGGNSVTISWGSSPEGAPQGGYRIDIFDKEGNLKLSLNSKTNSVDVGELDPGEYDAIVYTDDHGIFKRITDPIPFSLSGGAMGQLKIYSILLIAIAILLIAGAVFFFIRRKKGKKPAKPKAKPSSNSSNSSSFGAVENSGFSIIEVIVSVGILLAAIAVISIFIRDLGDVVLNFDQRFGVQQEIELTLNDMTRELKSIQQSNEGSYPISAAASSSIAFYTDIGNDGLIEKVRYFLNGNTIQKGVTTPSGNPLTYDPAEEVVTDVVSNISIGASAIFKYYDENFTGSEDSLAEPVTISDIRLIEIYLAAQESMQKSPTEFYTRITPRNL